MGALTVTAETAWHDRVVPQWGVKLLTHDPDRRKCAGLAATGRARGGRDPVGILMPLLPTFRRLMTTFSLRAGLVLKASLALRAGLAVLAVALPVAGATAQECGNGAAGFDRWIGAYKTRAASQGISPRAIAAGLTGVTYDSRVIGLDRGQKSFKLSFEQFYARRVNASMIKRGQGIIAQRRALFDQIEARYGVPGAILVSIWGLETNFGGDTGGRFSIIQSLATLAYDCRRSAFFENELTNGLKIIDRGDISAERMRGGWAGEIGPMQFLPSSYAQYAVDFDGDKRRDLFASVPRHARIDRQLHEAKGLESWPALGRGHGQPQCNPRVEQGRGLRQNDLRHGREGRGPVIAPAALARSDGASPKPRRGDPGPPSFMRVKGRCVWEGLPPKRAWTRGPFATRSRPVRYRSLTPGRLFPPP